MSNAISLVLLALVAIALSPSCGGDDTVALRTESALQTQTGQKDLFCSRTREWRDHAQQAEFLANTLDRRLPADRQTIRGEYDLAAIVNIPTGGSDQQRQISEISLTWKTVYEQWLAGLPQLYRTNPLSAPALAASNDLLFKINDLERRISPLIEAECGIEAIDPAKK